MKERGTRVHMRNGAPLPSPVVRSCEECGDDFLTLRPKGIKTCSDECQRRRQNFRLLVKCRAASDYDPTVTCAECGSLFTNLIRNMRPKYCSSACQRISDLRRRRASFQQFLECRVCRKTFDSFAFRRRHTVTCSPECARERNRAVSRARGIAEQKVARQPRPCVKCGVQFTPTGPHPRSKKYCTPKCRNAALWARYHPVPPKPVVSCRQCGTSFQPIKGRSVGETPTAVRYCSTKCRNQFWNDRLWQKRQETGYYHSQHVKDLSMAYRAANEVVAAGIKWNRKTTPHEVIAIAELIRETKALLKNLKGTT